MKTIILGLGNPILTDDAVGIKIAQKIKEEKPNLEVAEACETGIALLDLTTNYDKLIIIDSIKTEQGKPGELYRLKLEDLKNAMDLPSSHSIGIATAFELGQRLGYRMPRHISIYAVDIKDNTTFGEECTQEVEVRIPSIASEITAEEKL